MPQFKRAKTLLWTIQPTSETSRMSNPYNLAYPDYNGSSEPAAQPPFSPIDYEEGASNEEGPYAWRQGMAIEPEEYNSDEGRAYFCLAEDRSVEDTEVTSHPGSPWFRWHVESRRLEFRVWYQGKIVSCKFLHYRVEGEVMYKMGTEGKDQQQFQWELHACLQPELEGSTVNNKDLNIFIRDSPFNFAVEQALEQLGDPGVLADVGHLQTLSTGIPVFAEMVEMVQELTKAMYSFHTTFNSQVACLVNQLGNTKGRLEWAHVCSHVQNALFNLSQSGDL